jgi:glycosyltransferase involved in cell wall biosynthesis
MRALREAGARVEEAHAIFVEQPRDKSAIGLRAMPGLCARLSLAYLRLVPEVALRLLRCDALMLGYIGQLDVLALAPVAKLLRRPVVFNPLVTLTDTLVEDRRRFGRRSAAAWLLAAVDRIALGLSDIVVTDTTANADYLRERFGIARDKLLVLPVGADEEVFSPRVLTDAAPVSAARPLDVLFVGKFIPLHGAETIVHAAALMESRHVPARVELVGRGQTWQAARDLAVALDVTSITWTDWLPAGEYGRRLRQADVALGIFDDGDKAARVVPNKVYQALACGVPAITRAGPGSGELLTDGEDALLVPPADAEALAGAIERLVDPRLRTRLAIGARATYNRHASSAALARALRPLLDMLQERAWRPAPARA